MSASTASQEEEEQKGNEPGHKRVSEGRGQPDDTHTHEDKKARAPFWKRHGKWILGFAVLATVVILAAREVPLADWLERIAQSLRELGWLGIVLYAGIVFVAAMFCLPCLPLTLTSGYVFGVFGGVIAMHTGTTLAAACGFLLGRFAGRARAADMLRNSKRFHFLEDAIKKEGWKIVALLRMHAIPFGLSNYLYGMTSLEFWHYLLASTLAMLPGHFIYVYLGKAGGRYLEKAELTNMGPAEWSAAALSIGSTILLGFVITRIVRTYGRVRPME